MKKLGLSILAVAMVAVLVIPMTGNAFPYFIDFNVKGDRPGQPSDPVNGSLTSYGFFSFDSSLIPPGGGDISGEIQDGPFGTEILGLGATNLQFTWDSHTWTTEDADVFRVYLDAAGNCLAWSIGGATVALNQIIGGRYPDFWVQGPGIDFKYTTASSRHIFDGTMTSWQMSLGARAFAESSARTVPVGSNGPELCVWIEPSDGAFQAAEIDPPSIQLSSPPLGSESIQAVASKPLIVSDRDHNGVTELGVCFNGSDLYHLLGDVNGRHIVKLVVRGRLLNGFNIRAELELKVVGTGPTIQASVSPNPLNPTGTLSFETSSAGPVRVQIFSASGRLVRTLLDVSGLPAGLHEIPFGARDGEGHALATGVYFYRIETKGGEASGRVAVLK